MNSNDSQQAEIEQLIAQSSRLLELPEGQAQPSAAPPGWYVDPHTGNQRWWDGAQWAPLAPVVSSDAIEIVDDPAGLQLVGGPKTSFWQMVAEGNERGRERKADRLEKQASRAEKRAIKMGNKHLRGGRRARKAAIVAAASQAQADRLRNQ